MTEGVQAEHGAPLRGITVVELGNFIAAPFAGKIFAEFGADVIKVERPGTGDELRGWRSRSGETSMMFRTIARNKRSVTIDLHRPEGQELVKDLIKHADVVLENFRPGTLERWGLGPKELEEMNPDVVIVRISGYGQTGPYRERAGFGSAAEAFGGLRYVTGSPDSDPARSAASLGDVLAGMYGVIGALMMLLQRNGASSHRGGDDAGPRPIVDVALYESVFSVLDAILPEFDAYGVVRERAGGKIPGVVPSDTYVCADGKGLIIGGNSGRVFARLMETIGRPDLAADPGLQSGEGRAARAEELEAAISAWVAERPLDDAYDLMSAAGVPAAPVMTIADIASDPHYQAREMLITSEVVIDGSPTKVQFPGVVPRIAGTPIPRTTGPALGAHTHEVLSDLLGIDDAEIKRLETQGVV